GLAFFKILTGERLRAVVQVDPGPGPSMGERTLVSGGPVGLGPPLRGAFAMAVERDRHLVVADLGLRAVVRLDPVTGERTLLSDAAHGTGPVLGFVVAIAVERDDQLVVVDAAAGA